MPDEPRFRSILFLPILVLLTGLNPATAQDQTKGVLGIEGEDDRAPVDAGKWPWVAIGQINREIGGHCTGALIAPDRVLTAAHCLYNFNDGRWTIPMEVHFVAGYERGEYKAHARAKKFTIAPDWNAKAATTEENLVNDWAVLLLDQKLDIEPIPVSELGFDAINKAAKEGELTIAAYNGDYGQILTRHKGCDLAGENRDGSLLLHECDATYGASGAPLLLVTEDGAEIVGVQSAVIETNDGRTMGAAVPIAAIRDAGGID
jgi:protease YdgD